MKYFFIVAFLSFSFLCCAQLTPNKLWLEGSFSADIQRFKAPSNYFDVNGEPIIGNRKVNRFAILPAIGWRKSERLLIGVGLDWSTQKSKRIIEGNTFGFQGETVHLYELSQNKGHTITPSFYWRYFIPITERLYFAPKAAVHVSWQRQQFKNIIERNGEGLTDNNLQNNDILIGGISLNTSLTYQINNFLGVQVYFGAIRFQESINISDEELIPVFDFSANFTTSSLGFGFYCLIPTEKANPK